MTEDNDKHDQDNGTHLDWRDYIALTIAALQTTLLPFIVFIIVLLVLMFAFKK